ncbi:hypothetical protein JQ607_33720 [Bradyrhizobium liaoningense]|uniref:hypothetical protein n=1 Tax=Bradyrhizobium liaoningense TaxID=43992 RepID=UPI001BAE1B15|nr:hypothetical protein [Bradyrhizobium liaoningense]MBR0845175.1 hypothetical protein [Bradyrhizobium liaoningense]
MIALLGLLMAKDLIKYPAEVAEFQEKKIEKSVIGRRTSMAKTIHIISGDCSGSLRGSSLVTCPRDASGAPRSVPPIARGRDARACSAMSPEMRTEALAPPWARYRSPAVNYASLI